MVRNTRKAKPKEPQVFSELQKILDYIEADVDRNDASKQNVIASVMRLRTYIVKAETAKQYARANRESE